MEGIFKACKWEHVKVVAMEIMWWSQKGGSENSSAWFTGVDRKWVESYCQNMGPKPLFPKYFCVFFFICMCEVNNIEKL